MDSDPYLMTYPAFLIGQPPTEGQSEQVAVRMVNGRPALPHFTETLFAERFMEAEGVAAGIILIPSPVQLANFIRRYRDQLELVIIDPNPANNRATAFEVGLFLSQLEA